MSSKFKGQPRTMADYDKPKQTASAPIQKQAPVAADQKPWEPKVAPEPEELPGPGKRFTQITKSQPGVVKPAPEVPEEAYRLRGSDIPNITKLGAPKTFADVRKAQPTIQKIAKIRFDIRLKDVNVSVVAQFLTSETIDAVYDFLMDEIFEKAEKLELYTSFPRALLKKDGKHLAGLKIQGLVKLNVELGGEVVLKV